MWGKAILFVTRTQTFSVYSIFKKWFAGVTDVGSRPEPELQAAIDGAAKVFGWTLDKANIQREAYRQSLSRHLVPTLTERDAIVLAGKYNWTLHMISSLSFLLVYPIMHMLHGFRHDSAKFHSAPPPGPTVAPPGSAEGTGMKKGFKK
jgi:hypothetical protein